VLRVELTTSANYDRMVKKVRYHNITTEHLTLNFEAFDRDFANNISLRNGRRTRFSTCIYLLVAG
jgi:hypothetical protein